jgi:hypothetical protein
MFSRRGALMDLDGMCWWGWGKGSMRRRDRADFVRIWNLKFVLDNIYFQELFFSLNFIFLFF